MASENRSLPDAAKKAELVTLNLPEWLPVKTSDYRLRALRDRHYAGGVGGATVGPPGRRLGFVTFEGTAGWISAWPDPQYVDHAFGDAFTCTMFRKECPGLASRMIEAAIALTEARWGAPPPGGWLTFVDPDEVASPNPGYCFKMAGFVPVGFTKDRGLIVLRRNGCHEGVEPLTPHADGRMQQGRGTLAAVVPGSKTGAACGRGEPRHERGINGGTDTSSASGRVAVPRSLVAA